jgi:hypothetical protein
MYYFYRIDMTPDEFTLCVLQSSISCLCLRSSDNLDYFPKLSAGAFP